MISRSKLCKNLLPLLGANIVACIVLYLLIFAAQYNKGGDYLSPLSFIAWVFMASIVFFSALQIWLAHKMAAILEELKMRYFILTGCLVGFSGGSLTLVLVPNAWYFAAVMCYSIICQTVFGLFFMRSERSK